MSDAVFRPKDDSVADFISQIADERMRQDSLRLIDLMQKVTGEPPRMWGGNIIGFGQYHYVYDSGHEGDACLAGFSPRAKELSIYVMPSLPIQQGLTDKLGGKHRESKACLYLKNLDGVDMTILREMVANCVKHYQELYPDPA